MTSYETKIWALTGGVASGKSSACEILESLVPNIVRFDADASVAKLLDQDTEVQQAVRDVFGSGVLNRHGAIDRGALRARVFDCGDERRKLEEVLHPLVRKECLESLVAACKMKASLFLAEIPLLFESQFNFGQERNLLVAVSKQTQLQRLRRRSNITREMANAILSSQWSTDRKIEQADVVFWNEGPVDLLHMQLSRFLST